MRKGILLTISISFQKRKDTTRTYTIYYPEHSSEGTNNFLYPETGRGGDHFRRDASRLGVSFAMPHLDGAYA